MFPSAAVVHPLHLRASQWFDRAQAALGGALPCRNGCFRCCIGPFPVTILDRAEIHRGLPSLTLADRTAILERAREQVRELEATFPKFQRTSFLDGWEDSEVGAVVESYAEVPCQALGPDGSCRIYSFRPTTCRTMGIPPDTAGVVEGACEVQTFVPIRRLPRALREEETRLAEQEAEALDTHRRKTGKTKLTGEEVLLPYAFLEEPLDGGLSNPGGAAKPAPVGA